MTETTLAIFRAALIADPTISPAERRRLVSLIQEPARDICPRLLRPGEVARRLGVCRRTVANLRKQGVLVPVMLPGRSHALGFREIDVSALIEGRC